MRTEVLKFLTPLLYGIALGVSGMKLYNLHQPKTYTANKVVEIVQVAAHLSCLQGVVEYAEASLDKGLSVPVCEDIAKQWSDIYIEKKK